MFMLAISCRRHSVLGLSMCLCVRDRMLQVCEHDMQQTACGYLTKFTT